MKKILEALDAALKRIPGDGKKTLLGAALVFVLHFIPPHIAAFIPFENLVDILAQLLLGVGAAHKGVKLALRASEAGEDD